jgi:hypothetical protein
MFTCINLKIVRNISKSFYILLSRNIKYQIVILRKNISVLIFHFSLRKDQKLIFLMHSIDLSLYHKYKKRIYYLSYTIIYMNLRSTLQ